MTTLIVVYAICGLIFTIIEHYSYDWNDMEGMSNTKVALNILHQFIHYSRCIIVWPWYLVEDLLIVLDNKMMGDDDQGPPDDGAGA
jgi:hypothetical protein